MPRLEFRRDGNFQALSDADLVRLALQRDGEAFREIMQRHNRRLYRVARSVVHDDSEAEDVVQEAYVLAFGNLAKFRAEVEPGHLADAHHPQRSPWTPAAPATDGGFVNSRCAARRRRPR